MPYQITQHTADVRLKVTAPDLSALFKESLAGMMKILRPKKIAGPVIDRKIKVQSLDRTALLVDFLNEVLTQAEINKEGYDGLKITHLSDTMIKSELTGFRVKEFGEDIKAVTYHEADIRADKGKNLKATLVFDI